MIFKVEETKIFNYKMQLLNHSEFYYDEKFISNYSIMIGHDYISIDVIADTGLVYGISGYTSKRTWINTNLSVPNNYVDGQVKVLNSTFIPGTGTQYQNILTCHFDKRKNLFCFGDTNVNTDDLIVRIATGVFFVIRKEQVVSIIVRPIFIN